MMIRAHAYPRAGLIGNPSDGYFGKTISFTFDAFQARVVLYESPELEILPEERDHARFNTIEELVTDVRQYGYYGGIRLIKASIKRFYEHCEIEGQPLHDRNFTIRYHSNIPGQVGLAGSSAIITAAMRALMEFYEVTIPAPILANVIREVETLELGISAGLQDRVAQVYEGAVFMDFDKATMKQQGYGTYIPLPAHALRNLYIAYRQDLSEGSEIMHNDLAARFRKNDPEIISAMSAWADLTQRAKEHIENDRFDLVGPLLNENFDLRRKLCSISEGNLEMVQAARSSGATAKFCGSGGAIVGTYADDEMYKNLVQALEKLHILVLKPNIIGGKS